MGFIIMTIFYTVVCLVGIPSGQKWMAFLFGPMLAGLSLLAVKAVGSDKPDS